MGSVAKGRLAKKSAIWINQEVQTSVKKPNRDARGGQNSPRIAVNIPNSKIAPERGAAIILEMGEIMEKVLNESKQKGNVKMRADKLTEKLSIMVN